MDSKLVYSGSAGDQRSSDKKQSKSPPKINGPLKVRRETKSRGGKVVTVIFNISLSPDAAKALLKCCQQKFAVGGTFKNDRIELRGDVRDPLIDFLKEIGHGAIGAGG